MAAERLLERSVFIRELLPQDLKLEIDQLTRADAMKAAHFLAAVVGKAHARQMDPARPAGRGAPKSGVTGRKAWMPHPGCGPALLDWWPASEERLISSIAVAMPWRPRTSAASRRG